MPSPAISEQQILAALRGVSPDRWGEVLQFLGSMQATKAAVSARGAIASAADLARSGMIGLWQGRGDLGDSAAFARRLRIQSEQRGRRTDAP